MKQLLLRCEDSADRVSVRETLLEQAHVLYDTSAKAVFGHFTARTCNEPWARILPYIHGQGANNAAVDFEPWPLVDLVTYVV
jgi:hypothetical protein